MSRLLICCFFLIGIAILEQACMAPARVLNSPPNTVFVVKAEKAPSYRINKNSGFAKLFLNAQTGATDLALSVLTLNPGAAVPPHRHPTSSEAIYLEKGLVEVTIEEETFLVSAGDALYIPAQMRHSAKVIGSQSVKAIQIYVKGGPEKRFRKDSSHKSNNRD